MATPRNGAAPITADDYDIGLLLSFEGGFHHWRILLPFLPRADGAVAAGGLPTKATILLFEMEDLLLAFVLWEEPAPAKKLVDTTKQASSNVCLHTFRLSISQPAQNHSYRRVLSSNKCTPSSGHCLKILVPS